MSRFDTIELIRDFLKNQYENHLKIDAQLQQFFTANDIEKINAIQSDANFASNMKLRFTIDQLSKAMPFNYQKLRYALFGSIEADVRNGRQNSILQDFGIVIHYDFGYTKPQYSYDPTVLAVSQRSALSRPINVTVESNPIPVYPTSNGINSAIPPVECTKPHCPEGGENNHTFVENMKKFMEDNLMGKGFPPFEGKDHSKIINLIMDNAALSVRQWLEAHKQSS